MNEIHTSEIGHWPSSVEAPGLYAKLRAYAEDRVTRAFPIPGEYAELAFALAAVDRWCPSPVLQAALLGWRAA